MQAFLSLPSSLRLHLWAAQTKHTTSSFLPFFVVEFTTPSEQTPLQTNLPEIFDNFPAHCKESNLPHSEPRPPRRKRFTEAERYPLSLTIGLRLHSQSSTSKNIDPSSSILVRMSARQSLEEPSRLSPASLRLLHDENLFEIKKENLTTRVSRGIIFTCQPTEDPTSTNFLHQAISLAIPSPPDGFSSTKPSPTAQLTEIAHW